MLVPVISFKDSSCHHSAYTIQADASQQQFLSEQSCKPNVSVNVLSLYLNFSHTFLYVTEICFQPTSMK